jgi:enoyl-CoA hydratase/carnithine racemase
MPRSGKGLATSREGCDGLYKPIVAAVDGLSFVRGFEAVLVCDIRVAWENAKFDSFEIRRGSTTPAAASSAR